MKPAYKHFFSWNNNMWAHNWAGIGRSLFAYDIMFACFQRDPQYDGLQDWLSKELVLFEEHNIVCPDDA